MENRTVSIVTLAIATILVAFGYLSNARVQPGSAIAAVEGSNVQGVVGIILLLMLVVSIFFVVGNIKVMLTKNFHKK